MTLRCVIDRTHASTALTLAGVLVTAVGHCGWTWFWVAVSRQAGPDICVAAAVVMLFELRKIGGKQACLQTLVLALVFVLLRYP
jgi:hypothetical protein